MVTLRNKSNNAMYAVWLAGSVTDPKPADAKVVNPGETFTLKAPKLGDIKTEPFFMVQNLSDVNPCSYEITFTGLRKKGALQKSQVKSGELQVIEEEVDAAI